MVNSTSGRSPVRGRLCASRFLSDPSLRHLILLTRRKGLIMDKIRVLLVDDHKIVREGLHALLEFEPSITVIGEAETGRQSINLAKDLQPDVVVMDIAMPQLNGLEATRQILREAPGV